jgi:DNA-binding transcriptional regulator YiaG
MYILNNEVFKMARLARKQTIQPKSDTERKAIPRRKNPTGLHKVYDPIRFPTAANVLCKEHGFNKTQLAEVFGVTTSVISNWTDKHEEFRVAVKDGLDKFETEKIERTLVQLALGFEYDETTVIDGFDKLGRPAQTVSVTTKKALPNIKAIQLWLVNRDKARWKLESHVTATSNINTTHTDKTLKITADLSKMDVTQLKALRDMIQVQNTLEVKSEDIEANDIQALLTHAHTNVVNAQMV